MRRESGSGGGLVTTTTPFSKQTLPANPCPLENVGGLNRPWPHHRWIQPEGRQEKT